MPARLLFQHVFVEVGVIVGPEHPETVAPPGCRCLKPVVVGGRHVHAWVTETYFLCVVPANLLDVLANSVLAWG